MRGQVYIEIGIPIGPECQPDTVEPNFSIAVHTLKFQDQHLAVPLGLIIEDFFIQIVPADKPACIRTAGAFPGTGFCQHGIMGQGDRRAVALLLQMAAGPVLVEIMTEHSF